MRWFDFTYVACMLFAATMFNPGAAEAVFVTIENDLSENEQGGILEVTDVVGRGVTKSHRVTVSPGETKKVSPRNITAFVVSRVYGDFKERYAVECPTDPRVKDAVRVTLKSLVENELEGGCVVARTGKWTVSEGTAWDPPSGKQLFRDFR